MPFATVTVSLLMLIPSLMLSLTNISAFTYGEQFFISSICNYYLSIYFLYNTNQCCFVHFFILQVCTCIVYNYYCVAGIYCTHSRKG